ncbi:MULTISPECIES: hypothetical protein [Yersinia]|uniref:hypothetical protein n=1 Tax=Yersinia TaxID=629 RepID=UPI000FFC8F89|nr:MULTISPECIES: hypothetical protein [Yersinia]RXA94365.1 hypothetical protein EQP49_19855 [Yersinia sp. 2105 StPb PI]
MLDILKMQPLIRDLDFSDKNIMRFTLNGVPAKAIDYSHSICIGLVFMEKKMISDAVIRYITLMLVALEDTQDFALQLTDNYWWLWCRFTTNDRETLDDARQNLSIKLEQTYAVTQHFNSLATTLGSVKTSVLGENRKNINKVALWEK